MPKLRMHNFTISLDGYAAGPDQSRDNPLGVGGERLHDWFVGTRAFQRIHGKEGGEEGGIEAALERALEVANGEDVLVGGGAATIQQYLRAGLIDEMHVAIAPILLGADERLFDNLGGGPEGYECVELVSSLSAAHVRLARVAA